MKIAFFSLIRNNRWLSHLDNVYVTTGGDADQSFLF